MKLTLLTLTICITIAVATMGLLSLVGVDIAGNDCRYSDAVGRVCY